ncbi:MAG: hypothetical protein AAFZ18_26115 [Myxococcota bacterium]
MNEHLSPWAIDRARLGDRPPEVQAHLDSCEYCRGLVLKRASGPVPTWVKELEPEKPSVEPGWLFPGLGAAATLAAALVLYVGPSSVPAPASGPADSGVYVGEKSGHPSVTVHVERDGEVRAWSGEALHGGDRLQLTVANAKGRYLTLLGAPSSEVAVYSEAIRASEQALAKSLRVDEDRGPERLWVVVSDAPLGPPYLIERLKEAPHVWIEAWVFPKKERSRL